MPSAGSRHPRSLLGTDRCNRSTSSSAGCSNPGADSGQGAYTSHHVSELTIVISHPGEHLPSPGLDTGPLIEVGQRVSPPEVIVANTRWDPPTPLEHGDGFAEPTLIGQGASGHQTALSDERATGRGITKFDPQRIHVVPPALGTMAVGQHRVLLGASSYVPEHL